MFWAFSGGNLKKKKKINKCSPLKVETQNAMKQIWEIIESYALTSTEEAFIGEI